MLSIIKSPPGSKPMPYFHKDRERILFVPWVGLEPTRPCDHEFLRLTRIPIPPPRHSEPLIIHYLPTSFPFKMTFIKAIILNQIIIIMIKMIDKACIFLKHAS
jgi:hypothetical protein